MIKQSKNATKIVQALKSHPAVVRVHHPSLFVGDQARIVAQQCNAPGSMVAFELAGGRPAAFRFLNALKLVRLAVSLGGVESLASHPRTTTASEMSEDDLQASGITEGLVRLSVGVEYWRDLATICVTRSTPRPVERPGVCLTWPWPRVTILSRRGYGNESFEGSKALGSGSCFRVFGCSAWLWG
jgi:hypothetical protein